VFNPANKTALLENALLRRFVDSGDYTDCFVTRVHADVSFPDYVEGFYTTAIFKTERLILNRLFTLPSADTDARQLANGNIDNFAAWNVL